MHVYHPSNKKQEQKINVPLDEVPDLSQRRDPTRCTGAAEQLQVIKALQHAPHRMF